MALIEYMKEIGMISSQTCVLSHVSIEDIKGKNVAGVLPPSLGVFAKSITEIQLKLEKDDRGKELSLKRIKEIVGKIWTYKIEELKS